MSKFEVGDEVLYKGKVRIIEKVLHWGDGKYVYYFNKKDNILRFYNEEELELYKTPHERLLEMGFEHCIMHGYDFYLGKEYDIVFIFDCLTYNIHNHKKDYIGVNLEVSKILVDYLKELENE